MRRLAVSTPCGFEPQPLASSGLNDGTRTRSGHIWTPHAPSQCARLSSEGARGTMGLQAFCGALLLAPGPQSRPDSPEPPFLAAFSGWGVGVNGRWGHLPAPVTRGYMRALYTFTALWPRLRGRSLGDLCALACVGSLYDCTRPCPLLVAAFGGSSSCCSAPARRGTGGWSCNGSATCCPAGPRLQLQPPADITSPGGLLPVPSSQPARMPG